MSICALLSCVPVDVDGILLAVDVGWTTFDDVTKKTNPDFNS